jgi:hypothetical protein
MLEIDWYREFIEWSKQLLYNWYHRYGKGNWQHQYIKWGHIALICMLDLLPCGLVPVLSDHMAIMLCLIIPYLYIFFLIPNRITSFMAASSPWSPCSPLWYNRDEVWSPSTFIYFMFCSCNLLPHLIIFPPTLVHKMLLYTKTGDGERSAGITTKSIMFYTCGAICHVFLYVVLSVMYICLVCVILW